MDKRFFCLLVVSLLVAALATPAIIAKPDRTPKVQCNDNIDNDGDGHIDMADAGCYNRQDNDETNCGDAVCEGGEACDGCIADCGHCNSCSETDGGNVIAVFGITSGYFNNNPYSNSDTCVDSSSILEYYCSGVYKQNQQQSCGTDFYGNSYCAADLIYKDLTDYFCSSGACDSDVIPVFQEDCNVNDGYGAPYCSANSVYKNYLNYYCSSGTCNYNSEPELVEACYWGCTGGVCDPAPDSCSDTDGGNVISVFGTTSGYLNNNPYSSSDTCTNSSSIIEYFCSGNYEQSQQQSCGTDGYVGSSYCLSGDVYRNYTDYYCSGGACDSTTNPVLQQDCVLGQYCSGGACYWSDSCSDTDGGGNPLIQGTVSGYKNDSQYSYTDYCNGTKVIEHYCMGTQSGNTPIECAYNYTSCSNGACI